MNLMQIKFAKCGSMKSINNFKIIVPVYNSEKWINKCLMSIINQKYRHWYAVVIDDNSNDKTLEIIKDTIQNSNMKDFFKVYKRMNNMGALENIVYGISKICNNDDDIIVLVDGDDWLYSDDVLDYLNEIYSNPNIWLTYGSFISESKKHDNFCKPITDIKNYRKSEWVTSHLRTFKYKIWKNIKDEDLRDQHGNYFRMSWDQAIMYPLIEMCGLERIKFIEKILYVYNDLNPLNDFKKNVLIQLMSSNEIRNKPKYSIF